MTAQVTNTRDETHRSGRRASWLKPSLWVSWRPNGIGLQKPNHYRRDAETVWQNRHNLPYAWRILTKGVCDGCALGVAGLNDWTIRGVHLCTTRLNLLQVNTARPIADDRPWPTSSPAARHERRRAARGWVGSRIRWSGSAGASEFRRVSWDEALDLVAGSGSRGEGEGRRPDRLLPDQPRHHERGLLRRPEGGPLPRHELGRQRGAPLPRPVDEGAEAGRRRRGDDHQLRRPDRHRPRRADRRQRGERAAGGDEVPLHGPQAGGEGDRRQPVPRARPRERTGSRPTSRAPCSARG